MGNYLEVKITIKMGAGTEFTILSEEQNIFSIQDAENWITNQIKEMPEIFKKFGDLTISIRRVYPKLKGNWMLLEEIQNAYAEGT